MSQSNREQLRRNQAAQAKQKRLTRIIGVGAAVLVVVLIGVFVAVLVQNQAHTATTSSATPPNATASKDGIVVNPGKATAGAPVVELFFDYQCPVCKQFEGIYGATPEVAGRVRRHRAALPEHDVPRQQPEQRRVAAGRHRRGLLRLRRQVLRLPRRRSTPTSRRRRATATPTSCCGRPSPPPSGITGADLTSFQACYDDQTTKAFVSGTNEAASKSGVNAHPVLPRQRQGRLAADASPTCSRTVSAT